MAFRLRDWAVDAPNSCVVKLDYRVEERWPEGVQLVEDEAGCSLNVGMMPGFVVVAAGGLLLGLAAMFAVMGSYAVWKDGRVGRGVELGLIVTVIFAVLFWGGLGAYLIRWQVRYGHLPTVYRLDVVRGVFARRGERSVRWEEWEVGRVRTVSVRELWVVGALLVIGIEGRRFPSGGLVWAVGVGRHEGVCAAGEGMCGERSAGWGVGRFCRPSGAGANASK